MDTSFSKAIIVETSVFDEINALLPPADEPNNKNTWDELKTRITVLDDRLWEGRVKWPLVERWLENFDGRSGRSVQIERLHALYLLAQFLYYGSTEIRVLLRALYRDLFLVPTIQEIRSQNGNTRDLNVVNEHLQRCVQSTKFLGVGNPSESGVHLLYYFRQENRLSKSSFLDSAQITQRITGPDGNPTRALANPLIRRYVFVDDVCGSGETAVEYSDNILAEMLSIDPDIKVYYFSIFGTESGMNRVRNESRYANNCGAVVELDPTYKCLSEQSRYLRVVPDDIDQDDLRSLALHYGELVAPGNGGGFQDSQMLMGFHHNTPDNTLPIIWRDTQNGSPVPWTPVFRRYPKFL